MLCTIRGLSNERGEGNENAKKTNKQTNKTKKMFRTILERSWYLEGRGKSLNSVKVLEKYSISLLGLEKALKFSTLFTPHQFL